MTTSNTNDKGKSAPKAEALSDDDLGKVQGAGKYIPLPPLPKDDDYIEVYPPPRDGPDTRECPTPLPEPDTGECDPDDPGDPASTNLKR